MQPAKPKKPRPSSALVPVSAAPAAQAGDVDALGQRIRAEMDRIERDEGMLPVRAVFSGCILVQVRDGIAHGQWGSWLARHFGAKKSTAYRYIAVAEDCIRERRLKLPELCALPQLSLELDPTEASDDAASALRKIRRFVGARTLRDLLDASPARRAPERGGARVAAQAPDDADIPLPSAPWVTAADRALWDRLDRPQRLAWLAWVPHLRGILTELRDPSRTFHDLDDATRADAFATLSEAADAVGRHRSATLRPA